MVTQTCTIWKLVLWSRVWVSPELSKLWRSFDSNQKEQHGLVHLGITASLVYLASLKSSHRWHQHSDLVGFFGFKHDKELGL